MRLIDADALIHCMCCHCTEYEECELKDGTCDDFDMLIINHAPTIDPVKHGKWIAKENPNWRAHEHDSCSICGWWNTRNARCYEGRKGHSLNYCPNCGAKMDKK